MIYIQYSYCSETFLTTKTSVLKADCQDNAHTFFLMDLEHLMYSPCQCNTGSNVKTTQTHTKLQCMHVCYVHLTDLCNTNLYGYIFSVSRLLLSLLPCVSVCVCVRVVCFCTYMCMHFCWEPKHLWEIIQGQIRLTESQHQGCIPAGLFENPVQKVSHIDKWIQTCKCMLPTEQCVLNSWFTFCFYNWESPILFPSWSISSPLVLDFLNKWLRVVCLTEERQQASTITLYDYHH